MGAPKSHIQEEGLNLVKFSTVNNRSGLVWCPQKSQTRGTSTFTMESSKSSYFPFVLLPHHCHQLFHGEIGRRATAGPLGRAGLCGPGAGNGVCISPR